MMKRAGDLLSSTDKKRLKLSNEAFFISTAYYRALKDAHITDNRNQHIQPLLQGSKLIAEYYNLKYGCNMVFLPLGKDGLPDFSILYENAKKREDFRLVYLLEMEDDSAHASPMLHIRENGKEALFLADSLGSGKLLKFWLQALLKKTGIKLYLIKDPRQADFYSCFTDALIMGKELTGKHPEKGDFLIPLFLEFLEKNSVSCQSKEASLVTKLPDRLLKTAQISSFLKSYRNLNSKEEVHCNKNRSETLDYFRERHIEKNVPIAMYFDGATHECNDDRYAYTRLKGIKYKEIISAMQYLHKYNDFSLEPEKKLEFTRTILQILKSAASPAEKQRVITDYLSDFEADNGLVCIDWEHSSG